MQNEPLSIITFLWNDGYRDYQPKHANALAKDIKSHCSFPYKFVCVYDQVDPKGFDLKYVTPIPLPDSAKWTRNLKNPYANRLPSSYRRLWAFSEEAKCLGDRVLLLDIDCLVVADLKPLFQYSDADFVGWKPRLEFPGKKPKETEPKRLGGGTWLLRTGTHTYIWEKFSLKGIQKAKKAGWRGSDQGWLSYNLAKTCVAWPQDMGIYNNQETRLWDKDVPKNAKIIHFNGKIKPWNSDAKTKPWFQNGIKTKQISTNFIKKEKVTIVCFWWNNWCGKHGPKYVSNLYESLKKHTTVPFNFVCLTDNPDKLKAPHQKFEPIYKWNLNKLQAYHLNSERIITIDLDTIILKNIDFILTDSDPFTTNETFKQKYQCDGGIVSCTKKYGQSLLKTLEDNKKIVESITKGSERFFYRKYVKKPQFWQQKYSGIYSYKHHCKDKIPEDARIIHFHGRPRPHEVMEGY